MLKHSPFCVNFMKDLLLLNGKPSDDKMVVVTIDYCVVFKDKPLKKMEDPGCLNNPITIKDFYLVEVICNLGASMMDELTSAQNHNKIK